MVEKLPLMEEHCPALLRLRCQIRALVSRLKIRQSSLKNLGNSDAWNYTPAAKRSSKAVDPAWDFPSRAAFLKRMAARFGLNQKAMTKSDALVPDFISLSLPARIHRMSK